MLLITRRTGEAFTLEIGSIKVRVLIMDIRENGTRANIGIEAPRAVKVLREELEGNEERTFAP